MENRQNMFGIHIPGVCRSIFPSSKQGDIDIARCEIPRKIEMNGQIGADQFDSICTKALNRFFESASLILLTQHLYSSDSNTFGSTQPLGKEGRRSKIIFPRPMRAKINVF